MIEPVRFVSSMWMRTLEPLLQLGGRHASTARALRSARMNTFPERYLSFSYLFAIAAALVAMPIMLIILRNAPTALGVALSMAVGLLTFSFVRLGYLVYPRMRAASRARRIQEELPNVIVLCYALARGGVNALDVFRNVAQERHAYGEVSVEFGVVVRNVDWFGEDLVAALTDAAATTPSTTLKGFFDGLITILNSGADPQDYFRSQAEMQLGQAEIGLERHLEQAGLLAEMYVSGLLVLPLLLIVILSGLAPLGGGQEDFIPLVVFAIIPIGTAIYMLAVETMLPSARLDVPRAEALELVDFGLDTLGTDEIVLPPPWKMAGTGSAAPDAASERLHKRLFAERLRERIAASWKRFMSRMVAQPIDAIEFSGIIGFAVAIGGGAMAWFNGARGDDLALIMTAVFFAAGATAALPIAVFHEARIRRARRVEAALPDTLTRLAGFNERGIGLLQSFQIMGRSADGPLAEELRALERDVSWNGSLAHALRRFRMRVSTLRMTKLGILLERASKATGNLKDVLDIAAADARKTEGLIIRQKQSMMSYVVVIYIVFAVFLYVMYLVADLFYGPTGFGSIDAAAAAGSAALARGLDPGTARVLFTQAVVIQGICCGLVAGRLGEGHFLSGIKHAVFLAIVAWVVFAFGVLA